MWDLPGPGIKPVCRVSAGRFLTTSPQEKSCVTFGKDHCAWQGSDSGQMKVKILVAQSFQLFVTPWTLPGSSVGFSKQEYWSRLPFTSPGNLPNPEIELGFNWTWVPHIAGRIFTIQYGLMVKYMCFGVRLPVFKFQMCYLTPLGSE